MKLAAQDITINNTLYDIYHRQYNMPDGWLPGNQKDNFHYLAKIAGLTHVSLKSATCLDVGCGSGDLSLFLRRRGITQYLGIDIYEKALENARKKYPQEAFITADFLEINLKQKFDFVFCSGALTVKLATINNYDYLHAVVTKMWSIANIGVAFNVLTDDDPIKDPDLFFYSPNRVKTFCQQLASKNKIWVEKNPGIYQIHLYLSHG